MHVILIKDHLPLFQIEILMKEFPHYQVLLDTGDDQVDKELIRYEEVEILYTSNLQEEDLNLMSNLRWIHVPQSSISSICIDAIKQRGNILVSSTEEEDMEQVSEFAMAAVLAFSKQFFKWKNNPQDLSIREEMWSSEEHLFYQIGLGPIGSEIAKKASLCGFHVYSFQQTPSFHPTCLKNFALSELKEMLPKANIICVTLPKDQTNGFTFSKELISQVSPESLFMFFGDNEIVNFDDLAKAAKKWKGIAIDTTLPIPKESTLWKMENALITPGVARYPKHKKGTALRSFLFNMRQFLHGNFADMRNLAR